MARIDVHAHYMNNEYLALLEECGNIEPGVASGRAIVYPSHEADLEARFRVMDRAGVDRQILSASGLMPYFENVASGGAHRALPQRPLCGARHRASVALRSVRLITVTACPESLSELARCLDDLHFVGISVATSVLGKSLGDPFFDPVYAELDRRGAILFHPSGGPGMRFSRNSRRRPAVATRRNGGRYALRRADDDVGIHREVSAHPLHSTAFGRHVAVLDAPSRTHHSR